MKTLAANLNYKFTKSDNRTALLTQFEVNILESLSQAYTDSTNIYTL